MTRYDLIDFSFDTDLDPLRDHFRRCFQESYGSLLSKTSMAHLLEGLRSDDIGGLLPPPDAEMVLACVEGEIVGSAIWARRGGRVYLWGFYVRRSQQRQKIGSSLMAEALSRHPAPAIFELTVLRASQDAVSFYQRFGFLAVSETEYELAPAAMVEAVTMTRQPRELTI